MSLLAELQRRNVIRMAGLYLVVAWLVVQVAGTVLPIYGDTPDSQDELLRLSLSGVYHWNDRIDVTGRYIYETRDAEDWGWSDQVVSPATPADPAQASARYLAFAWERPDYSSQLVMMSVRYKF